MKHVNIEQVATPKSRAGRRRLVPGGTCCSLELGHLSALKGGCFWGKERRRLFGAAHP